MDANNNIVAPNFTNTIGAPSNNLFLDGSTTSGVVYGYAFSREVNYQLYAGLLSTTDLGAPLTDDTKNGNWTGTLAGFNISGTAISDDAFDLTVAFGEGTKAGTIKSPSQIFNDNFILYFDGEFDANGVMSGTANSPVIDMGVGVEGTFNGLIGVNGAVGVFRGIKADGSQGYAGGFQVKPPTE